MSEPSEWHLSSGASRVVFDVKQLSYMQDSALSRGCLPRSIGFYPSAYRHEMSRTQHDDYLLMMCVGGSGRLKTSGFEGRIHGGDIMLLPPGVAHYYAASEEAPWSLFWVHFSGDMADSLALYLGFDSQRLVMRQAGDAALQSAFHQMLTLANDCAMEAECLLLANQLRLLLLQIKVSVTHARSNVAGYQIERVKGFMRDNLGKRLVLDDFLALTHYSKYHFMRQFKSDTGQSPLKFFEGLKMDAAKMMLESSTLSVGDIARELAFDDPLYFSRVFRKNMGVAPREYRLRHKTQG